MTRNRDGGKDISDFYGELKVFIATHDYSGRRLPKSRHYPLISDGRYGELYEGDANGARALAADLLAAADAYDRLSAELRDAE